MAFSGSRSQEKLGHAGELAGPNARTGSLPNAAAEAEVVVVAVPFDRYPDLAQEAGDTLRGKLVIDTSNPIAVRDGRVEFLAVPDGLTAAQHQQRMLGDVRLVKAFNTMCASEIDELATHTGDERVAVLIAGDDPVAKETLTGLVADAGFVPVDVGRLADAAILEPTSIEESLPVLTGYRLTDAGVHPNPAKAVLGIQLHTLEPDPITSPIVVWIFEEYVSGKGPLLP